MNIPELNLTPAQQRALARGQPVHPHPHGLVTPGAIYHHIPTATTFRVLCNCAGATPAHYTQRSITTNPNLYRPPTGDEMRAFLTALTPAQTLTGRSAPTVATAATAPSPTPPPAPHPEHWTAPLERQYAAAITAANAVLTPPQPPATLQPSTPKPLSDGSSHAS